MKKILFTLFLVSNICFSQEKIPFIDYTEIETLVSESANEGDYLKALEHLNKISKNDSAYYDALSSKSYYLIQLDRYDEVIKVADEGINDQYGKSKATFYINKGVGLSSLEKYPEAIENYNLGLKLYPNNYLLWYNKGVAYEHKGDFDKAFSAYKKCISLNPMYKKPHLQMGNILHKQERSTQALMCFNLYLLLDPGSEGAFSTLKSLNNAVLHKNVNNRNPTIELFDADDSYEDIDLVLDSKMAIDKKYKIENKINIALAKQNHAMIKQLNDIEGNGGFWDQKYAALYKWILEEDHFDDFIYTLSYSIENPDYKKIIDKNKKNINAFFEAFKNKWASIVSENVILFDNKQQKVTYNYNGSYVSAIGNTIDGIDVGYWEYYKSNGNLSAKGSHNNAGERIGEWTWYNGPNKISETVFYENGKLNGKHLMLHENEKKYVNAIYKDGKIDGEYTYFNDKGALIQKKYFKDGNLEGIYKSYFKVGEKILEFYVPYKNDLVEGEAIEYYAHGSAYSKANYVAGKINGIKTTYHYNDKIASEAQYTNGTINGLYKSYYANGQLNEEGQSLEGSYDGLWKVYYSDGTLKNIYNYKKGKLDGLNKNYDTDRKLHFEYVYRRGEIIAYKIYDKKGVIIKDEKKKDGEFLYVGFSPLGVKTSEGLYDISGGKKGRWKFYSNNGMITGEGDFIDNKANGDYFNYYNNGKKKTITPYKEDVIDGYYTAYHLNGNMSLQGWYKNGTQQGEWRYYYLDGTIESINFFHSGDLHGEQEYFGVDGSLMSKSKIKFGEVISEILYDNNGKVFEQIDYSKTYQNEYLLTTNHFNGKIKTKVPFVNGVRHGLYEDFYFDGKKETTGNYVNGEYNGLWTWYYDTGEKETEVNYLNGNRNGSYTTYYKSGKVEAEYYYENGYQHGNQTGYYENGNKEFMSQYYEGEYNGRREFYDPSGQLQLIRFYNHGRLIGYSYLNKENEEVPMIEIINETGTITAYYDNGNISKVMEYKNGDLVNTYKSYFYNENKEDEMTFADDEYNGVRKEYYINGKIKNETEYSFGEKHGKSIEYYENGKIKEEKTYVNDELTDIANLYNQEGKLKKRTIYFNDKVVAVENF